MGWDGVGLGVRCRVIYFIGAGHGIINVKVQQLSTWDTEHEDWILILPCKPFISSGI